MKKCAEGKKERGLSRRDCNRSKALKRYLDKALKNKEKRKGGTPEGSPVSSKVS